MKTVNNRTTKYPIDDIFLKRYSPRAFSGEVIAEEELMTLFEAARWAPSVSNIQPWRFVYATREMPEFEKFLACLIEGNKIWCEKASALAVVLAKKTTDAGKPSGTYSLDAGSSWENLALQASGMNLIAHGMAGIYFERIREELAVPEEYAIEMMIAIGKPGKIEDLPEPLRLREAPSDRKPLEEIVFKGKFPSLLA